MSGEDQNVDAAFMREARTGLMILVALLALLIYVAAGKLGGWHSAKPIAFQDQQTEANAASAQQKPQLDERWLQATSQLSIPNESRPVSSPNSPLAERPKAVILKPASQLASSVSSFSPIASPAANDAKRALPSPAKFQNDSGGRFKPPANPQKNLLLGNRDQPTPKTNLGDRIPRLSPISKATQVDGNPIRRASATEPITEPTANPNNQSPTAESSKFILTVKPTVIRTAPEAPRKVLDGSANDAIVESDTETVPQSNYPSITNEAAVPLGSIKAIKGDSFWLIAQRVYGEGQYFNALFMQNKDAVPSFNEIPAGTVIVTPSVKELRERWASQCPRQKIVTEGGETPFQLACDHLGQASRYLDILKSNYQVLPKDAQHDTRLPKGLQLVMPRK